LWVLATDIGSFSLTIRMIISLDISMFRLLALVVLAVTLNSQIAPTLIPAPPSDENRVKRLLIIYTGAMDMDWNSTGTRIATGTFELVRMWDGETLEQRYFVRHNGILNGIDFNDSGDRFLTWSYSEIRVWDTETGDLLGSLTAPSNVEFKGVIWNENRILYLLGATIGLWDGNSPQSTSSVYVPGESFLPHHAGVSWNLARTRFLTWNEVDAQPQVVRVWTVVGELDDITQDMTLPHDDVWIDGAEWSPDETMIVSWSQNMVKVWDAATAELLHVLNADSYVTTARWSPNSRYILVEDIRENAIRVWNARAGEEVLILPGTDAMWDTTGERLLVGRQDIALVDVATGDTLVEFGSSLGLGYGIWNPDGVRLLVETAFGVQVWIIPPRDRCVVHTLAPTNLRAEPRTASDRVDVLLLRQLALVSNQTIGADDFIWWQLESGLWVRSDVVIETGRCFAPE
jgi:WD40 repeat protein